MRVPPTLSEPVAYRLAWKPGDYCFYSLEEYEKELYKAGAECWGLFEVPQIGCLDIPAVYKGTYFVRPKNLKDGIVPEGFIPLYLGPILNQSRVGNLEFSVIPATEQEQRQGYSPWIIVKEKL